jgi:septal ring factor EnvC (AmiA/AmiB activator)
VPKQPEEMTLEELAQEMRKRTDSLDHLTAKAEMTRRQVVSSIEATSAQKAAADAATINAQYMLWSVIVAAIAAVASALSAVATAYSVWPKK